MEHVHGLKVGMSLLYVNCAAHPVGSRALQSPEGILTGQSVCWLPMWSHFFTGGKLVRAGQMPRDYAGYG